MKSAKDLPGETSGLICVWALGEQARHSSLLNDLCAEFILEHLTHFKVGQRAAAKRRRESLERPRS